MIAKSDRSVENRTSDSEEWVDVRMRNPDAGEWEVDVVVFDGRVEYVDLRVRRELLASFVDSLIEDVDDEDARTVLSAVVERHGIELPLERE